MDHQGGYRADAGLLVVKEGGGSDSPLYEFSSLFMKSHARFHIILMLRHYDIHYNYMYSFTTQ